MHTSVLLWASDVLSGLSLAQRRVLEVGSLDVNGSLRPLARAKGPAAYVGVDLVPGLGVDVVGDCRFLADVVDGAFDLVIATEVLEHVEDWAWCVASMVQAVVPGGHLLLTTRSVGFPYHPYPIDTWRYSVAAIEAILLASDLKVERLRPDPDPRAPGVFALAAKPFGWVPPWVAPSEAHLVLPADGVTAVSQP